MNDISYQEAKKIAAAGNLEARRELAGNQSAPPEILYYLASDESLPVRRAVANNISTPLQADMILTNDTEPSIRMDLAVKIGTQLGRAGDEVDDQIYTQVNNVLDCLISDRLHTVRAIVAEEVKRLENVPKSVIRKLAQDAEVSVSAPVLEHSPLLEDAELIEFITKGVKDETLTAIARRENIGTGVTQSITDTHSIPAIGAMLENQSANLTTDTLDDITGLAADHDELHRPLTGRDDLPEPILERMAGFVGGALVEELIERYPLSDKAQKQLRAAVTERIASADLSAAPGANAQSDRHQILLAEDEPTMRILIRQIIESFFHADVTTVGDGDDALHLIESGEIFDLIICDWMMPNMSGIDFLTALRDRGDKTSFVMLTARKDVDSIVAARNHGVDAFIAKPVTAEEIQSKLRALLR